MFSVKFDSDYLSDRKCQISKHAIALYKHSNLEEILKMECRTDLEKRLKLEVCSLHRCVDNIVQILCSDDKLLIRRALQLKWIFKSDSFIHVFRKEIYPSASKWTFLKIVANLRKHTKSNAIAQEYYTFLKEHKEYKCTVKILPLCSSSFIFEEISSNKDLNLKPKLLNEVSVKCPLAANNYLDKIFKIEKESALQRTDVFRKYFVTFRNLAKMTPDSFVTLYLEIASGKGCFFRKCNKKFGYRTTKILLNKCGRVIIERIGHFIYILDTKALYRYLRINLLFDQVYDKILKKIYRYIDFASDPFTLLTNEMKKDERLPKMIESYNRIIKKDILRSSKFASSHWPILLESNFRNDWAAAKMQLKGISWCRFMTTEESMKILKGNMCTKKSLPTILRLFTYMIDSYVINGEDDVVLVHILNVLKENFCEYQSIAQNIIEYLCESLKLYTKSVQLWTILKEILDLLKGSVNNNGFRHLILEEYIRFSIASNTPLDKGNLDEFVRIQSCRRCSPRLNRQYGSYEFEKSVLDFVLRHIENTLSNCDEQEDCLRESIMAALFVIDNFNVFVLICRNGKKRKVSLAEFPWLANCLISRVGREDIRNGFYTQLKYMLLRDGKARKYYIDILLDLEISESFLLDMLIYNPRKLKSILVSENFLREFSNGKMKYIKFYQTMRLYYHDDLCDEWKSTFKFHVNGFDMFRFCIRKKLNAAFGLTCLMEREEFEVWSDCYLYEGNPEFFTTTSSLIKNLHHISPIFPSNKLLGMLQGDLGVLALPAFWSIAFNLPRCESVEILKKIKCDNSVVVKNVILAIERIKKNQY